jgi:hypothetical protein
MATSDQRFRPLEERAPHLVCEIAAVLACIGFMRKSRLTGSLGGASIDPMATVTAASDVFAIRPERNPGPHHES